MCAISACLCMCSSVPLGHATMGVCLHMDVCGKENANLISAQGHIWHIFTVHGSLCNIGIPLHIPDCNMVT